MNNLTKFFNINPLLQLLIANPTGYKELEQWVTFYRGKRTLHIPLFVEGDRTVHLRLYANKSGRVIDQRLVVKGKDTLEDFLISSNLTTIEDVIEATLPQGQAVEGYKAYSVIHKVFGTRYSFASVVLIKETELEKYAIITKRASIKKPVPGYLMTQGADWDGDISYGTDTIFGLWERGMLNDNIWFIDNKIAA